MIYKPDEVLMKRIGEVKRKCLEHGVDWLDGSKTETLTVLDIVESVYY